MPRKKEQPPVQVRSMNQPKDGWTEADAIKMLQQGYDPAHVEKTTGYTVAFLQARQLVAQQDKRKREVGRRMTRNRVSFPVVRSSTSVPLFREPGR